MTTPLLATKLYVPLPRPNPVPRPRLTHRLDEGLRLGPGGGFFRKLTLISAPAGYGKTTLVVEWISGLHSGAANEPPVEDPESRLGKRIAWLSLDEGDNDAGRFFAYLVAALQTIDPAIGHNLDSLLGAPQPPPPEELIAHLINDIATRPSPLLLVLDDYHTIAELSIHEAVGLLLEHQPPHFHLILTTRHDPALPLPRLRGRGQVTEIREGDLRFTPGEAVDFFRHSMGLDLAPVDVAALEDQTEGWIAGLQMAALSLRAQVGQDRDARDARAIASFTGRHQFILDYLTDEVLKRQPETVQTFLLRTSILERMTAPLCDVLLAEKGQAQALLEHLDDANLFVVPLDAECRWYRYHRLFADLLQARLQDTQPALVPDLHRRASAWYEANDLAAQAVHHALASGDLALAADLIERVIQRIDTWSRVDGATYLDWWRALPRDLVQERPRLGLFAARALYVTGQAAIAEEILDELEGKLQVSPPAPGSDALLDRIVADRASYAALRGEADRAIDYARRALARSPEGDALARVRPTSILGLAYLRSGDVAGAEQAFRQTIAVTRAAGMDFAAALFVCNLGEVQIIQGQLRQAYQTNQQALDMGTVEGKRTTSTGFASMGLARIHYQWNELEEAEHHIREGVEQLRQARIPASFGTAYACLAQIQQAQGDPGAARASMRQAMQLARSSAIPRLVSLTAAHQARLWLGQEGLEMAARWADGYRETGPAGYLREFEDLTLARVLLAGQDPAAALTLLDRLLDSALEAGRGGSVVEILALRALGLARQGALDPALESLGEAFRLGELEGYVRLFADEGEPMAHLLHHAARRGLAPAYVRRLVAALQLGATSPDRVLDGSPPPVALVEPLTPRELDILRLLAEGLTNPEIAQRLYVSLPTVKTHTRNLYGKLGVHSRREAVACARSLGLL